jgi:predicted DsbA family dithiol-disulfide isomerase
MYYPGAVSLDVQIWSDIACPWCYIGKRRFERALAQFPQREQVTVHWRSYQLDPSLPDHDHRSEVEYLVAAKGLPVHSVEGMVRHVTEQAAGEGLDYDFDALVVANSRRAHRVLQAAKRADAVDGAGRTDRLKEALLSAHFEGGRNIGAVEVLTELAEAAGLTAPQARAAVGSDDLDDAVARDIAEAAAIGVRGVPFFVFDGRYGVSGAQPPEVFLQALEVSWSERTAGLITIDGATGEACGPDGCA